MKFKTLNRFFLGLLSVSYLGGLAYAITCGGGGTPIERYTVRDSEVYCLDQSGNIASSGTVVGSDLRADDDLKVVDDADIDSEAIVGAGIKLGDAATPTAVPSTTTGSNYGLKIPVYNGSVNTIAQGSLVLTSTAAPASAFPGYVTAQAVLSTTTWVGIADADISASSYGWAVVSGYASAITTGTVAVGDQLTSTGSTTGLGAIAPGASVVEGSVVGIAVSSGPTTGGLTLIRIGR